MNKFVVLISVISVAISSLNLYLLSNIPDELKRTASPIEQVLLSIKNESKPLSIDNPLPATVEEPLQEVELKNVGDIDKRLRMAGTNIGIEEFSKVITEVDEWFFVPEDEAEATKKIETMTQTLRNKIDKEVTGLSKEALESPNGKTAAEKMSRINTLLTLYPSPVTNVQRENLNQTTSFILSTSKRVEELQRLRYNKWAIEQIKNELLQYRKLRKVESVSDIRKVLVTDKDELLKNCVDYLRVINPALLEPSALDLYSYAYGLTKDALGSDDSRLIKLAEGLSNLKVRWNLSSF